MNITHRNKDNSSISRRNPFDPFNILDDFFGPVGDFWSGPSLLDKLEEGNFINNARYPIRSSTLEDSSLNWEFDVPGCDKEDLNIEYDEQQKVLSVSSEQEEKTDGSTKKSSFSYSIKLPNVDVDTLEAKVEKGVLSITAKQPEKPDTKRKISVK